MRRNADGTFADGNAGGPGNPYAKEVAELRNALLAAVTPEDIEDIVSSLVEKAKSGDTAATKVLFDRLFGKPKTSAEVELANPTDIPMPLLRELMMASEERIDYALGIGEEPENGEL